MMMIMMILMRMMRMTTTVTITMMKDRLYILITKYIYLNTGLNRQSILLYVSVFYRIVNYRYEFGSV